MDFWLKCRSVSEGILPGEYAIVTSTSDGREISLFAPENYVRPDEGLIRVTVLERSPEAFLIYLPADPFEVSRTVKVSAKEIISF